MSILARRTKNDQFGDGRNGYLTPQTVGILKARMHAARIEKGCLFWSVMTKRVGSSAPHPHTVNRVIQAAAQAAGLDQRIVRSLSGHSMRVGAAQDLMADGVGLLAIVQAGGWKSMNVIGRYVKHANLALCGQTRRRTTTPHSDLQYHANSR